MTPEKAAAIWVRVVEMIAKETSMAMMEPRQTNEVWSEFADTMDLLPPSWRFVSVAIVSDAGRAVVYCTRKRDGYTLNWTSDLGPHAALKLAVATAIAAP